MSNLDFFEMVGTYKQRKVANDKINDIVIDTCRVTDIPDYNFETGININDKWIIVEEYKTKEEAMKGHEKWKKNIINGQMEFTDCSTCGIATLLKNL